MAGSVWGFKHFGPCTSCKFRVWDCLILCWLLLKFWNNVQALMIGWHLSDTKLNFFLSKMQKWMKSVFKVSVSDPQGIAVLRAQLLCSISLKGITTLCEGAIYNLLCVSSAEIKDRTTSIKAFPHLPLLTFIPPPNPGHKGSGGQGAQLFMSTGGFEELQEKYLPNPFLLPSSHWYGHTCTLWLSIPSLSRGNKDLTKE